MSKEVVSDRWDLNNRYKKKPVVGETETGNRSYKKRGS